MMPVTRTKNVVGRSSGSLIRQNVCQAFAPSMRAASSRWVGIDVRPAQMDRGQLVGPVQRLELGFVVNRDPWVRVQPPPQIFAHAAGELLAADEQVDVPRGA